MNCLYNLRSKAEKLYDKYHNGFITLEKYLEKLKYIDNKIDRLESKFLKYLIQDIFDY